MSIKKNGKKGAVITSLAVIGAALAKFKGLLLVGAKSLSFLKLGWIVTKLGSLLLSFGFYAAAFGWSFAAMIILLLFLHEGGHWIWMKAYGLNPKPPVFIPFVGAYVAMTKMPPDEGMHAWVAFAGPLVGGVTSAIMYLIGIKMDITWLMVAGKIGFLLNLFQLIPARPLDGGFIAQAISKWLLIPGAIGLIALALIQHSVLLLIISIMAIGQCKDVLFGRRRVELEKAASGTKTIGELVETIHNDQVHEIVQASKTQRIFIGLAYLVLALSLGELYSLACIQVPNNIRP